MGGADWQRGTRWLGGLSDAEIDGVERRWSLTFPPDYRLFIRRLHSVDRPLVGARYASPAEGGDRSHLIPVERPSFYNWLSDTDALRDRLEWPTEGLLFDVEHNDLWLSSWGDRPETIEERAERVRALVVAAPRLIPVLGHRFLLAEPCVAGNPVLSIYQSDIIVYGADLRSYLLIECAGLLGLDREKVSRERAAVGRMAPYAATPFWGELIAGNHLEGR